MTCIIGLKSNGKIYMGCDSAAASGWDMRKTTLPKVFIRDGFIIGYTGSFRMGQILQYNLTIPKYTPDILPLEGDYPTPLEYMVSKFIPEVRMALKENGFTAIKDNQESGGDFLVGFQGQLFKVASDFQVNQFRDDFDAIGCGAPYALGAIQGTLYASGYSVADANSEKIIQHALAVAGYFSNGVAAPYFVHILE